MAEVSYESLASMLLRHLGAPDNKGTNLAVQTWMKRESGANILGNNPLNIHYDVALSYGIQPAGRWWSNGDRAWVASFASLDDGMAATANILNRNIHGYRKASDSLRANDPIGFLTNIAASNWAASHYGGGDPVKGAASLIASYRNAGGSGSANVIDATNTASRKVGTTLADVLGRDITLSDPATIWQVAVEVAGKIPWGESPNDVYLYLVDFVGKKASEIPLQNTDKDRTFQDTERSPDAAGPIREPLDAATSVAQAGLKALQWLADPGNWVAILALLAGVGLVGYGIIVLIRGYNGRATTSAVGVG